MGFRILLLAWFCVTTVACAQSTNQTAEGVTVFEGARLIVGDGSPAIEDSVIWVQGDRFVQVGRMGELQVPAAAVRVDLRGKTVMPALVDAHSHIGYMENLTSGPENYTREHILDHMYRFAYHGVAASQAMGSDFGVMPFQLRDEILAGEYPDAARFFTAGRGLSPLSEVSPDNMRHAAYVVTTEEGARANIRELASQGVRLVKTWVANGSPEGDPANLPEPPDYIVGWQIPTPDEIHYMSEEPYDVPAEGVVEYKYMTADPGWTEDKWIKAAQARPDNCVCKFSDSELRLTNFDRSFPGEERRRRGGARGPALHARSLPEAGSLRLPRTGPCRPPTCRCGLPRRG